MAFDEGRLAPAASQKVPTVLKEQDVGTPGEVKGQQCGRAGGMSQQPGRMG